MLAEIGRLSPREREVLWLIRIGRSYGQVGVILGVTRGTVRTFVERAYRKLGIVSRREIPPIPPGPRV